MPKAINIIAAVTVLAAIMYFLYTAQPEDNFEGSFERTHLDLELVLYDNKNEMNDVYRELKDDQDLPDRRGWSLWYVYEEETFVLDKQYECEIHAVRPKNRGDTDLQTTYGHELFHCIWGDWHPETKEY